MFLSRISAYHQELINYTMKSSLNAFFDRHMFVHTHLEKCGGSTLLHHLTTLVGKEHTLDLRPFLDKESFQGYREIQKKGHAIRLLSGHFRYNSGWAKLVPNERWFSKVIPPLFAPFCRKRALYVASVRHPIDRLNSLFRYLKTRPRHYLYNYHVINNDFDGFIQSLVANNNQLVNNGMCAQLAKCAPGPSILEKTKKAFDQHYFAIVPFNKTHELANRLANVLQQPAVKEATINRSDPGEKVIPSQATIALLEKKCHDDIQLYDYIGNTYSKKLDAAEKYLRHLLNG